MKNFLREDQTMLDSQRQVTGIGDTAKGQMVQTPNAPSTIPSNGKMEMKPFQIDASIPKIGDMFVKMMELRAEFESAKNAITDLHHQLKDATYLYKENIDLKSKIAELESNLELALLDNQFLKEDIQNASTGNTQNFNEEE